MTALVITIPGRPPTPNKRRHWRTIAKDNERWKEVARKATVAALPPGWVPLARCRMAVEFVLATHADSDEDNAICAQKPCLDGIVAGGAIVSDSRRVIAERTYGHHYERGVAATVYTISALPLDQLAADL